MKRAEIFSIGDELLRGIVQDTNTHWLAQRITARGASVARAVMLPDQPPVVAEALREALAREPDAIFTHGGLGPTDDDRTREAVSLATGAPLMPHAQARAIVQRRYAELLAEGAVATGALGAERLRMSVLPRGSLALDNQVGAAPGIVLRAGATVIVCLPGVPPEMGWIFENPLAPVLDEVLGPGGFHEWTAVLSTRDESSIAQVLRDIQGRHPEVYVKSRAKTFNDADAVRITLAAPGPTDAQARALVEETQADLRGSLAELGVEVRG